jgi:uncharacterized lipoprotein NlpE involved in copper resistance
MNESEVCEMKALIGISLAILLFACGCGNNQQSNACQTFRAWLGSKQDTSLFNRALAQADQGQANSQASFNLWSDLNALQSELQLDNGYYRYSTLQAQGIQSVQSDCQQISDGG